MWAAVKLSLKALGLGAFKFVGSYKYYFYAGILAASFYSGWKLNGWYWEGKHNKLLLSYSEAVIESRDKVRHLENERLARLQEVENHEATKWRLLMEEGKTHEIEVIKYVTNPNTVSCNLDYQWLHHYNHAATGISPTSEASGQSDVTTLTALTYSTRNLNSCRADLLRFVSLQNWVRELVR